MPELGVADYTHRHLVEEIVEPEKKKKHKKNASWRFFFSKIWTKGSNFFQKKAVKGLISKRALVGEHGISETFKQGCDPPQDQLSHRRTIAGYISVGNLDLQAWCANFQAQPTLTSKKLCCPEISESILETPVILSNGQSPSALFSHIMPQ